MGKALDDKKVDMMTRTMSPEQAGQMLVEPKEGVKLTEMPGLAIRYLGFDTNAPSVKNKAVRQAVARVIDRGAIASKVYGTTAEPLYSLIDRARRARRTLRRRVHGRPRTRQTHLVRVDVQIDQVHEARADGLELHGHPGGHEAHENAENHGSDHGQVEIVGPVPPCGCSCHGGLLG